MTAMDEPEDDYPRTNSGPLCHAEESGHQDNANVFCPFAPCPRLTVLLGRQTNRERACIDGP